jgi:hypothetical protein
MKTLQKNPEFMTVIINIQMMNKKIDPKYNEVKDFKRLNNLDVLSLYREQDETIIKYNQTFQK